MSSTLFKMNVDSWALDRRDLIGQAKAGETAQHTVWALQTPESSLIVKITTYKNLCLLNTTCLKALRFQITLNVCVCWERTSFAGSLGQRVCADLGKPAGSKAGLGDSPACLHTPRHTTPQVWDNPSALLWRSTLGVASCTLGFGFLHCGYNSMRPYTEPGIGAVLEIATSPRKALKALIHIHISFQSNRDTGSISFIHSSFLSNPNSPFFTKENSTSPCFISKKGDCGALQSQDLLPISSGPEHRSL